MLDNGRLAIAAHLHVLLRRQLQRVTDVEWMAQNREYALEVVRIARASPHQDLHEWANKLEASYPANVQAAPVQAAAPAPAPAAEPAEASKPGFDPSSRYVGRLR